MDPGEYINDNIVWILVSQNCAVFLKTLNIILMKNITTVQLISA